MNAQTKRQSQPVAPVSAVCAAFAAKPSGVLAQHQKNGRCANVRERCGNAKHRRRTPAGNFGQRAKPQAAKQEKRLGAFLRQHVHICPQCGQFWGMKMALFCGCQKWNGAVIDKKPRNVGKIKDNFDAITISGGFDHENRRKKPPHRLDGRHCLVAGAGTLQTRRMQHTERIRSKSNSILLRLFTERVRWRLSAEDPW